MMALLSAALLTSAVPHPRLRCLALTVVELITQVARLALRPQWDIPRGQTHRTAALFANTFHATVPRRWPAWR